MASDRYALGSDYKIDDPNESGKASRYPEFARLRVEELLPQHNQCTFHPTKTNGADAQLLSTRPVMGCGGSKSGARVAAESETEARRQQEQEEEAKRQERVLRQQARAAKRQAAPLPEHNEIASMVRERITSAAMTTSGAAPTGSGKLKAKGKMGSARSAWDPTPAASSSAQTVGNYDDD